jgi:hypothetical protein
MAIYTAMATYLAPQRHLWRHVQNTRVICFVDCKIEDTKLKREGKEGRVKSSSLYTQAVYLQLLTILGWSSWGLQCWSETVVVAYMWRTVTPFYPSGVSDTQTRCAYCSGTVNCATYSFINGFCETLITFKGLIFDFSGKCPIDIDWLINLLIT